jgi:hypothetical protein
MTQSAATGGVVVAEASDPVTAAIWVDALRDAGIAAHSFEQGVGAALGGAATYGARFPVIVRRQDIAQARNVIADLDGARALAPYRDESDIRAGQSRALLAAAAIAGAVVLAALASRAIAG